MKKLQYSFLLLIIIVPLHAFAQSSVDFRTEYESWNSGIKGKSSTFVVGAGGSHVINEQWSISGGLVTGSYDFDESNDGSSADRQDVDIAIAYSIMPAVRVFGGYRLIKIKYDDGTDTTRSFTDTTHGLGAGVAAFQIIQPKLYVYGRFGISFLSSSVNHNGNPDADGSGIGSGLEGGLIYQFLPKTNAGLSIKQQGTNIDYGGSTGQWNNNYLRIGLSVSHTF